MKILRKIKYFLISMVCVNCCFAKSLLKEEDLNDSEGLTTMEMAGIGLGVGTLAMTLDSKVSRHFYKQNNGFSRSVADIGNQFGREWQLPIILGSGVYGYFADDAKMQRFFLYSSGSGLITQLITDEVKKMGGRLRPVQADNFNSGQFNNKAGKSFFSGHTSAAFSLATSFAEVYGENPYLKYGAYGLASLTAYARVHDQKHWLSDTIVGATMGYAITKAYIYVFDHYVENKGGSPLISPNIDTGKGDYSLQLNFDF